MSDLANKNKRDVFQKFIHKDVFSVHPQMPKQIPSLTIICSYDRYEDLFELLDKLQKNYPLSITLYDEERTVTNKSYGNIQELIRILNNKRINKLDIHMSDETMPLYNLAMYRRGWIHSDKTKLFLSIDRHPLQEKKLNLKYATGQIMLPEEKLLWVPQHTLHELDDRIAPRVFEETKKLKKFLNYYNKEIKRLYRYQELTDIEKTLIVYDNLRGSIKYAMERTMVPTTTGIRTVIKDENDWQSRPYGTLEHKRGVCEGQARLMVCMLNNPEMMVDACTINGQIPSGERHTWVGIHTNDRLYECCTTMQGPFKNLKNKGYEPDENEQYIKAYKRDFLTDLEYTKACEGVLRKKR